MPFNGAGVFQSLGAPTFPAVPNTYILASYFNATMNDIFAGLSGVMTRDGQAAMVANLPMGGFKATGLADGSAAQDAVAYHQVFDSPTIANPTFTGTVTVPTLAGGDTSTAAVNASWVDTWYAKIASPTFTGVPAAPTAAFGTSTTQLATTEFVQAGLAPKAPIASPTFTGIPAGPTAAPGTNTTQFATTAYVMAQAFAANLPNQTGNAGKVATTDGSTVSWQFPVQIPVNVTGMAQLASAGSAYALTNATAQGAATNLLLYSEQLQQASWAVWHCSIGADVTMAPDGNTTADKIVELADTSNRAGAIQTPVTPPNAQYTYSAYFKAAGRTLIGISMDRDGVGVDNSYCNFNLTGTGSVASSGVTGTASGLSSAITYVGNGWYRCSITATVSSVAGTSVRVLNHLNGYNVSYAGDGVSGIYAWGIQLESGSTPTSYIQSVASQGTRSTGVVAPQRVVLPASPAYGDWVRVVVANDAITNVIDPNGSTIMGAAGPLTIDSIATVTLQFINNSWRLL